MKYRRKQHGLTLTELVVVVAVVAILLGISLPTAQKIMDSFEHSAGAKGLIDAALTSARAMAITKSKPVGIRFQKPLDGNQYMVFIEYDPPTPATVLANGFHVVEGRKPIKLPAFVGVMDGLWVARAYNGIGALDLAASAESSLNDARLMNLSNNIYLNDPYQKQF